MKVIFIQRWPWDANAVMADLRAVDPVRAKEVCVVRSPAEVIDLVLPDEPTLVVASQHFDYSKYRTGTQLAAEVKKLNKSALFFIYSFAPPRDKGMADGLISKNETGSRSNSVVVGVLASKCEDWTLERLRALFSQIRG